MVYEGLCSNQWLHLGSERAKSWPLTPGTPKIFLFFFFLSDLIQVPFALDGSTCLGTRDWTHAPDSKHSLNTGLPAKSLVILSSATSAKWADAQRWSVIQELQIRMPKRTFPYEDSTVITASPCLYLGVLFLAPQISLPLRLPALSVPHTVFSVTRVRSWVTLTSFSSFTCSQLLDHVTLFHSNPILSLPLTESGYIF